MTISKVARSIGESATLKLNATAAALGAQGAPVIHLGGGEPVSKAPASAIAAGSAMLATGEVRYTPASGTPALRRAIVEYTQKYYRRAVAVENVMASGGAKQAIMVALQTVLDPGDEVVFPVPYWVSYPDMVRLCGATPVPVPAGAADYCPRLADIEPHVTPRTKAVLINSPNNPSGAVYPESFVADIVCFCEDRGLYLIMDDIYHRLVFDGQQVVNCYDYARRGIEDSQLIVVNGVSKQYAMTGFRIGWAVAARQLIKVMAMIQGHQTSGPSALSQQAALGALTGEQSSVDELRGTLEHSRDVLLEQLQTIPDIRFAKPGGTFYCLVDFRAYDHDSTKLAQFLLERAQVVTIPGAAFGLDGHLRISFCGARDDIVQGIARIRAALAEYPRHAK